MASPKHLSALAPKSEGMEDQEKPIRATVTFESAELQRRVRRYTVEKMANLREQSKAISELLDFALKAKGY